ncbi:hypothetical protein [Pseudomonas sp. GL-B-19]|uniref:hypothetical protein n=1 Tax=Pseudomonas sp. GL-B-19 TaxID=2832393 RepID=UPI001CC1A020|nr:hypothetical protein [Pseudomonas sp. GL-B-19]
MSDPMLLAPDVSEYRFALYCRGHLLDLTSKAYPPVALYPDAESARLHGVRMWPSTFTVIDLAGDERP